MEALMLKERNKMVPPMKKLLIFSIFPLLIFTSRIESSKKIKIVGRWDRGSTYDVIAVGNYLYLASGGQVRIYDISKKEKIESIQMEYKDKVGGVRKLGFYKEKAQPVKILHTGAGTIKGLYAYKNYLYVIGSKFVIADISKPEKAHIVSSLNIGGKDVHVEGNYAYITTPNVYGNDIAIVDVSDKKKPVKVGGFDVEKVGGDGRGIWRLYVEGDYLYTGDLKNYLYIIKISDPKNPVLVGKWSGPGKGSPSSFAKKGKYVFVTRYHWGFYVIDVSNPKKPVKVAEVIKDHDPNASDIKIFDDKLFLSTRYEGFRIYDISEPKNPKLITKFAKVSLYAEGIFVHRMPFGTYVMEVGSSCGLAIIDITDIKNPKLITKIPLPIPFGKSIKVKGNYAFIGANNGGGWIVDVSNPKEPKAVAWVKTDGRHWGVEIKDNYWFLSYGWGDLAIVDISNPEKPKFVYEGCGPNLSGYIVAVDNYLYGGGLRIYDISDPRKPKTVYNKNLGTGQPFALYKNKYLITAGSKGVFIIDISKRTEPKIVSKVNLNAYTAYGRQLDLSGDTVYVGCSGGYVYSIDISDPKKPKILGKVYAGGNNSIIVYKNYLYSLPRVASWGFSVIDVSDPSKMKVVERRYDIGGNDMDEENGLIYIASGSGLIIISPVSENGERK